jgi:predicted RNase H-like HicB family nuclease
MERYSAIMRKTARSDFGVEFPDLPGCFSAGRTLEEARRMGAEALRLHLDGLAEDGRIPAPSSLDAIERRLKGKRGTDFFAVVEIEAEPAETRVARINVTIDERLLREIDDEAEALGLSRSGFFAESARAAMRRGVGGRAGRPIKQVPKVRKAGTSR